MKVIKQRRYFEELRCRGILLLRTFPKVRRGRWICIVCGRELRRKYFDTYSGWQRPDQPCKRCKQRLEVGYKVVLGYTNTEEV